VIFDLDFFEFTFSWNSFGIVCPRKGILLISGDSHNSFRWIDADVSGVFGPTAIAPSGEGLRCIEGLIIELLSVRICTVRFVISLPFYNILLNKYISYRHTYNHHLLCSFVHD
jgi:hypothetical protein